MVKTLQQEKEDRCRQELSATILKERTDNVTTRLIRKGKKTDIKIGKKFKRIGIL